MGQRGSAGLKTCKHCEFEKPRADFYERDSRCKACTSVACKDRYLTEPGFWRDTWYRKNYGITLAEYDSRLLAQGNVCALCGSEATSRRLDVDHDHKTGNVRGLLCTRCNGRLLGQLETVGAARVLSYLDATDDPRPY